MDYKKLNRILRELDLIKLTAEKMFQTEDEEEFNNGFMDIAMKLEKLTDRTRTSTIQQTGINREDYLKAAARELDITVTRRGNDIVIRLPLLLPKRKSVESESYIIAPLMQALQNYINDYAPPKMRKALVTIKSVYSPDNVRLLRDNDNIEIRHVINAISTMLFVDDNMIDILLQSRAGNSVYTEIIITKAENCDKILTVYRSQTV